MTTDILSQQAIQDRMHRTQAERMDQYTLWLNHPVSPRTGETKKALWWWIIPLIVLVAFVDLALRPVLVSLIGMVFPFLAEPKGYDGSAMFAPELRGQLVGA